MVASLVTTFDAQSRTNRLWRPCPSTTTRAVVDVERDGDIQLTPCSGRSIFAGSTSVTTATTSSGIVADNAIVRGDGGARGVQTSLAEVNDSGYVGSTGAAAVGSANTEVPSFYDKAEPTSGFGIHGAFGVSMIKAGSAIAWDGATLLGPIGMQVGWSSSLNGAFGGGSDTAIKRFSAGVVATTDASGAIRGLQGGGAAVASAAALPLPTGNVFHVTGTTNVTSITSTNFASGVCITLIFDGVLTVTDGSNLKLAGNFVTTADDTITLIYDGTNWYETARAVN